LDRAYATILAAHPADQRGGALLSEVLRQLDVVPQRGAIGLSRPRGRFPAWFWLVLFAGAVLTISFTFFFGTQNVVVQTLMTGMLSRLIFAGLFVIVAIDRPFAGSVKVQPEALHAVLNEFGRMKHP
jgi:hypothetical protein